MVNKMYRLQVDLHSMLHLDTISEHGKQYILFTDELTYNTKVNHVRDSYCIFRTIRCMFAPKFGRKMGVHLIV